MNSYEITKYGTILPAEIELIYAEPKLLLGDWLVFDYTDKDQLPKRGAFNVITNEFRELQLNEFIYDMKRPIILYELIDDKILVCISTHFAEFLNPLPDGSEVIDYRYVEDWALISADEYLLNINY